MPVIVVAETVTETVRKSFYNGPVCILKEVKSPLEESREKGFGNSVGSITELKSLQSKIKEVVKAVQPVSIALSSKRTGASGSGVIVDAGGLILSAAHVVQGDAKMDVIFPDGRVFLAKVLGLNRTKDIAMLQIENGGDEKLKFAELGDSNQMSVGDYVISIGHAGGFDPNRLPPVRFGRLLSKNRSGFISSDCTLIGGDSGGPIFDLKGRVIGINSSIGETLTTNNHAGISGLKEDWDRLEKGEVWGTLIENPLADPDRPVMGFTFGELRSRNGVIIQNMVEGSPAHKAGLKIGDRVVAVREEQVSSGRDLLVILNDHKAGDEIELTIWRAGVAKKVKVKLVRRADVFKR